MQIDTTNCHMVSCNSGNVLIMLPPSQPMTPLEAKTFAAWLVTLANINSTDENNEPSFNEILEAVENA